MRNYVIIDATEVPNVDFSQVCETSADTLRYSVAGDQTFLKFEGEAPSFLEGKVQYSHSEMLEILEGSEWEDKEEMNGNAG